VAAARTVAADLVAYTSNLENHPAAVAALVRGRRLLGNAPAVLRRVRNPITLMRGFRARGLATPATRASAPAVGFNGRRWLLKPRQSGGGHGTLPWRRGLRVSRRAYIQERIAGVPGSIVFAADGRRAVLLGVSRQLIGERAFGGRGGARRDFASPKPEARWPRPRTTVRPGSPGWGSGPRACRV